VRYFSFLKRKETKEFYSCLLRETIKRSLFASFSSEKEAPL
jgi:hypothetical protein